jgi:hypothetical protein
LAQLWHKPAASQPRTVDRFRRALDWLNERTDQGIQFFGVEIGVVQIRPDRPQRSGHPCLGRRPSDPTGQACVRGSGRSGDVDTYLAGARPPGPDECAVGSMNRFPGVLPGEQTGDPRGRGDPGRGLRVCKCDRPAQALE